jgi:hypothetical protein
MVWWLVATPKVDVLGVASYNGLAISAVFKEMSLLSKTSFNDFIPLGSYITPLTAMGKMSKIPSGAQQMLAGIHACLGDERAAKEALAVFLQNSPGD